MMDKYERMIRLRKKIKKTFEELMVENRINVQNDENIMKEIEERIEKRLKVR